MKDQFANYVVQKIFELSSESQQAMMLSRIRTHAHVLKKYTYGKHIVARFEMLIGEGVYSLSVDLFFDFWIFASLKISNSVLEDAFHVIELLYSIISAVESSYLWQRMVSAQSWSHLSE